MSVLQTWACTAVLLFICLIHQDNTLSTRMLGITEPLCWVATLSSWWQPFFLGGLHHAGWISNMLCLKSRHLPSAASWQVRLHMQSLRTLRLDRPGHY